MKTMAKKVSDYHPEASRAGGRRNLLKICRSPRGTKESDEKKKDETAGGMDKSEGSPERRVFSSVLFLRADHRPEPLKITTYEGEGGGCGGGGWDRR